MSLEVLWSLEAPEACAQLTFSPDGTRLAAPTLAGPVLLVDAASGRVEQVLEGHRAGALSAAFSPDGALLATCGQDGRACVWSLATGARVELRCGGQGWTEHATFSADGKSLALAKGKSVHFFTPAGERLGVPSQVESTVTGLCWVQGQQRVLVSCYGGLRFLVPAQPQPDRRNDWKGSLLGLALSPDGRWAVAPTQDNAIHIWKLKGGVDLEMSGFASRVRTLAFAPNSNALANDAGNTITLWDFRGKGPGGREPLALEGHTGQVTWLSYARKAGELALLSASRDGSVRLWGPQAQLRQLEHPLEVGAVTPALDGAVVGDAQGKLHALRI